jgi:hypothetical protein
MNRPNHQHPHPCSGYGCNHVHNSDGICGGTDGLFKPGAATLDDFLDDDDPDADALQRAMVEAGEAHLERTASTGPVETVPPLMAEYLPTSAAMIDASQVGAQFSVAYDAEPPDWTRVLEVYAHGTDATRGSINDVLISLCGWSLPSLVTLSQGGTP